MDDSADLGVRCRLCMTSAAGAAFASSTVIRGTAVGAKITLIARYELRTRMQQWKSLIALVGDNKSAG